ncbi:UNVERIFIED_CONTAM: hypothetical protein Sangu_0112600 [Sesamum angustifolium]|uniref:Disease resistance R13L4/SHOC-2-like LRR domain-containing protein n=1 Tax=Sesamum angustifolium TaxID=2727405 RepID=A0AAW2RKV9_9LAMI
MVDSIHLIKTENDLSLENIRKVRSFSARYISGDVLTSYLIHLKRVRLLSLVSCNLKELPQEIGELIHLRYLELRNIPVPELPETLCNLYNLQTLDLEGCEKLSALPQGIHKLINLRHLLMYTHHRTRRASPRILRVNRSLDIGRIQSWKRSK